jgi:hypothetical protein
MDDSRTPQARGFRGVAFTFADRGPEGDDPDEELHEALEAFATHEKSMGATTLPSSLGWSGGGNAIVVVLEDLALAGGAVGAIDYAVRAAKSALPAARRLAAVWRRLRNQTRQEPDLSLGALVLLCIVDLSSRIETLDGVMLVSAVDLTAGLGASFGHVGTGQPCVVLFARDDQTWTYLVDSKGRLYSVGVGESLEWSFFWESGRQQAKSIPTPKLLDDIGESGRSD